MKNYICVNVAVTKGEYVDCAKKSGYPFPLGTDVLGFFGASPEYHFFETENGDHFMTDHLKTVVESFQFKGIDFIKKIDEIFGVNNIKDEIRETIGLDIWKIEIASWDSEVDFGIWEERYLLVSKSALKQLKLHSAFASFLIGSELGKEFEVLDGEYQVGKDPKWYFEHKYSDDRNFVRKKLKDISLKRQEVRDQSKYEKK